MFTSFPSGTNIFLGTSVQIIYQTQNNTLNKVPRVLIFRFVETEWDYTLCTKQ